MKAVNSAKRKRVEEVMDLGQGDYQLPGTDEMLTDIAWCMMGLTREEYDSEERKRSKEEKVFLMTNLRDLIINEGAAVACAKRRDALCFIRFMMEQISVPAFVPVGHVWKFDLERHENT